MSRLFLAVLATMASICLSASSVFACECGEEKCVGGWVQRCMAGGGGSCTWYPTNEVCNSDGYQSSRLKTTATTEVTAENQSKISNQKLVNQLVELKTDDNK